MRLWLPLRTGQQALPSDLRLRGMLGGVKDDPEDFLKRNWPELTRTERKKLSRELMDFREGVCGSPVGAPRAFLWQLVASGLASYAGAEHPSQDPARSAIEIAACALWPIVLADALKEGWYEALRGMSSEEIARLVAEARVANRMNGKLSADQFARFLTATPFAKGIMKLLDEMSDPRRGGASLTALAMAHGKPVPTNLSPQRVITWLGVAAGAGFVGNRADYAATQVWQWLSEQIANAAGERSGSSTEWDASDLFGSSSKQSNAHEGILQLIEDLFTGK